MPRFLHKKDSTSTEIHYTCGDWYLYINRRNDNMPDFWSLSKNNFQITLSFLPVKRWKWIFKYFRNETFTQIILPFLRFTINYVKIS